MTNLYLTSVFSLAAMASAFSLVVAVAETVRSRRSPRRASPAARRPSPSSVPG